MGKRKKQIIAISIVVLLVVLSVGYFTVGFVKSYLIRKDPLAWAAYGATKASTANTMNTTSKTTLKVTLPDSDYSNEQFAKFANDMSLKTTTIYDKNAGQTYYDMDILYKGQEFIDSKIYTDKQGLIISSPSLYSQNVYINWKDVNKLSNKYNSQNTTNGSVDTDKYKELFNFNDSDNFKKVQPIYMDFLSKKLNTYFTKGGTSDVVITESGNSKTIKCDNLTFNINSDQAIAIYKQLLTKAADDPNVKALVKEKFKQFFDIVSKNNDYKKFNMTKDDAKKFLSDFDKNYSDFTKKVKAFDTSDAESNGKASLKYVLKFDSDNTIRGTHSDINISSDGSENSATKVIISTDSTVNSINKKVDINKLSRDGAVNLATADNEKLQSIGENIIQNLQKVVVKKIGF